MPVADTALSATLAHSIRLDRNFSRVQSLSDAELEELTRDLLTHMVRWINGKERDLRPTTTTIGGFCSAHAVPALDTAWYLQLVREGVATYLSRTELDDSGELQVRANRFFDKLVCEVLRSW
jgi:hypothetical protein